MLQLTRWHERQQLTPMILIGIVVVLLVALPGCGGGGGGGGTSSGYYSDSASQNAGTVSQVANVTNLNNPGEPIRQGDWCQITGSGFGETQNGASSNGYVLFSFENGSKGQADLYQQWTDTQIICRIPTGVKRSTAARAAIKITVVHHDSQEFENAYGSVQITYDSTPNPSPEATPPNPIPSPTSTTPAPTPTSTEPSPTQTTSTPTPTQTSSGGGGGPTTGSIAMTVQDAGGNAIADAVLTYSKTKTVLERLDEFKTDANGKCTIGNLAPGTYNITAAKIGYSTTKSDDVNVTASDTPVEKTLTMTPAVLASIAVTPDNSSVVIDLTKQFVATGTLTDGTTQVMTTTVTWNSSDSTIATISNTDGSRGLATGKKIGTAKITAAQGDITSPEATLNVIYTDGTRKWTAGAGISVYLSRPAIGNNGYIFFGTEVDRCIHAIDPADGSKKWSTNFDYYVNSSPAIGSDGTVYVCCQGVAADISTLYALDPENGAIKWTFNNGGTGDPAIGSDGLVYISGTGGGGWGSYIYAINPASGPALEWSYKIETGGATTGPVIASDGTVYVRNNYTDLLAVEYDGGTGTGRLKWSCDMDSGGAGRMAAPAIADDGTLYVQTSYKLYSINPVNGGVNWIYPADGSGDDEVGGHCGAVIGIDGTIYVGAAGGLYAINPNGTLKWKYSPGIDTFGNPVAARSPSVASDGRIYIAAGWEFHAVDPNGNCLWKYTIGTDGAGFHVTGTDGTIYVLHRCGSISALYGSFSLANSPWPMFNKDIRHTGQK